MKEKLHRSITELTQGMINSSLRCVTLSWLSRLLKSLTTKYSGVPNNIHHSFIITQNPLESMKVNKIHSKYLIFVYIAWFFTECRYYCHYEYNRYNIAGHPLPIYWLVVPGIFLLIIFYIFHFIREVKVFLFPYLTLNIIWFYCTVRNARYCFVHLTTVHVVYKEGN